MKTINIFFAQKSQGETLKNSLENQEKSGRIFSEKKSGNPALVSDFWYDSWLVSDFWYDSWLVFLILII